MKEETEDIDFRKRSKIQTNVRIDIKALRKMAKIERRSVASILDAAIEEYFESRMDCDIRMETMLNYATESIYLLDLRKDLEELSRRQLELRLAFQQIKDICEKHVKEA